MEETGIKKHHNNNKDLLKLIIRSFNLKQKYRNEKAINNTKTVLNAVFSFKFN